MILYLVRRLNLVLITAFLLTLLAFAMSYAFPGDPLSNMSGIRHIAFDDVQQLVQRYGLELPLYEQYWRYLQRLLQGDWGLSFATGQPVLQDILHTFPATLELSLYALLIALTAGIPLGLIAGIQYHRPADRVITVFTLIGYSIPVFWLALMLIIIFAIQYPLLPISGRIGLLYEVPHTTGFLLADIALADIDYKQEALTSALRHLILPVTVLTIIPMTVTIRIMKSAIHQVMQQNYIKAARTKGLTTWQIIRRHALRNAMYPVIQQLGIQFNTLITLAMITEIIFSWPGMGSYLVQSIYQRDYPAIQGGLLAVSGFLIVVNVLLDMLQTLINPLERRKLYGTH